MVLERESVGLKQHRSLRLWLVSEVNSYKLWSSTLVKFLIIVFNKNFLFKSICIEDYSPN